MTPDLPAYFRPAMLLLVPLLAGACAHDGPTGPQTVRLSVVSGAEHGGLPLKTPLTQEVTGTPPYQGDPDGAGTALITVNLGQREVCWELSVTGITLPATASHIHRAPEGIRGDIVIFLSPPDASGTSVGCRSGLDPTLLHEILTSPESFYANVHTADFPASAIRGQLGR